MATQELYSEAYQGSYRCEITATVTVCTSFMKAQMRPVTGMERGGGYEILPLPKELVAIDSCWEREDQFSLGVLPLASWPCSSGRPHIYVYIRSTNWT